MVEIGSGPLWRIDGPPPVAPKYGLIQASRSTPVVRIVDDADPQGIERWINGVALYVYPVDAASIWNACDVYSSAPLATEKESGDPLPLPKFDAYTVYLPISCTSFQIPDQDAFRARAVTALGAVEGAAIERELLASDVMLMNPHMADGQGDFPEGNTALGVRSGIAALEDYLASFGKAGVIHMSPGLATVAGAQTLLPDGDVLRTNGGNVVIAGAGYAEGATPANHPDATGTQEWVFATGPIDIRRSEVFTVPETPAQALDRGMGATMDVPNELVYRAERYYAVVWDTAVQAAVLIDRCLDLCAGA